MLASGYLDHGIMTDFITEVRKITKKHMESLPWPNYINFQWFALWRHADYWLPHDIVDSYHFHALADTWSAACLCLQSLPQDSNSWPACSGKDAHLVGIIRGLLSQSSVPWWNGMRRLTLSLAPVHVLHLFSISGILWHTWKSCVEHRTVDLHVIPEDWFQTCFVRLLFLHVIAASHRHSPHTRRVL